ncbi:MAG: ABC transporter ATP-binding protein/permease [Crocinitomicaceae bacterium]|nr:ABC transporter ATP-binding protein/permease [Crocinitomicaceae bacterium]|tara:strand:+ start:41676 stop:43397 length:1722 start_codon:yes stop_codon:yes gene_type:complete
MSGFLNTSPLRRFFNLLKVDRQEIISIYIYALFHGLVALSLPLGIQAIISLISGGQVSTSWVILVVLVIAGIGLSGVIQIMQLTISENLQQKIFTRSAFEFAYRIPRMKLEAIGNSYMPELVNRFFDTLSVQKGLSKILMDFSSASLLVLFGLILLCLYHPFFILFSLVLLVIVYLIFRFTAPKGLKTSLVESQQKYEVAHWLEELARAMETFKLAGNSPLPLNRTDHVVQGYLTSRKAHFKTLRIQYINLVGFKVIIAAGLLLIGGLLVINQQMNIGQFVASEIIIILVLASVEKLILSMETIYDVLTAIEKIGGVTDLPIEGDSGAKLALNIDQGLTIHLNNISYKFKNAKEFTIKDVSMNIDSNDKICLTGYDGSGKSVLLQIIAGLYDQYSGAISYNGIPLGNWSREDLRSLIGDSLSKEDIFKGSLFENISLSKSTVGVEEVQKMAEVVGLTDFVENQPAGYEMELLPEGKNLPKSIRLKVMLARSIAGNPRLVLLEDNFNQLNQYDKKRFLDYLMEQNCTVIAVSNDPFVAEQFHQLAVLKQGKLVAYEPLSNAKQQEWYSNVFQRR